MKKKKNEFWPTILIMEGRPYRLKELNRQGINNPCELCDLRMICGAPRDCYNLAYLCHSDKRGDAWFFEEDWNIYPRYVSDFINVEFSPILLDQ